MKGRWCHLTADDYDELHAMAKLIGLRRSWFQKPKVFPDNWVTRRAGVAGREYRRGHYDVVESKRAAAVHAGTLPVGNGCEPWRTTETAMEEWVDFLRTDEGKAALEKYKAETGQHPARHPS